MGFMDRIKDIGEGAVDLVGAPVGLVADLASAPFTENEYEGFIGDLTGILGDRFGQTVEAGVGETGFWGSLIGAVPEPVRGGANAVIDPVKEGFGHGFEGLETAYREGPGELSSTFLQMTARSGVTGSEGLGAWFRGDYWGQAYARAQNLSPGQAFALGTTVDDITNEREVASVAGTDAHTIRSGMADAVIRLTLEPDVLAGAAWKAHRAGRVIASAADVNKAAQSGRVARFTDEIRNITAEHGDGAASVIRQRFFPQHRHGGPLSVLLEEAAAEGDEALTLQVRSQLGDVAAHTVLRERTAARAAALERLMGSRDEMLRYPEGSLFRDPAELNRLKAEIDELYPVLDRLDRQEAAFQMMREVPRRGQGRFREAVRRSHFYQNSPLGAPLRVTTSNLPHRTLNLHDPAGDVHVFRMLNQSGMPVEQVDELRRTFTAATNPGQRLQAYEEAEEAAIRYLAEDAGLGADDLEDVLRNAKKGRRDAMHTLQQREYDGNGRSTIWFQDDDGWHAKSLPMDITQEQNLVAIPDMREARRAAAAAKKYLRKHAEIDPSNVKWPSVGRTVPREILDGFNQVWKPSVLLRVGWPLRVITDEQLRIVGTIGTMSHTKAAVRNASRAIAEWERTNIDQAASRLARAGARTRRGAGRALSPLGKVDQNVYVRGHKLQPPFGVPEEGRNLFYYENSSAGAFSEYTAQRQVDEMAKVRATGDYRAVQPTEADYPAKWEHAVNNTIGQGPLWRRIIADGEEAAIRWLSTPEGIQYRRRLPTRGSDPEGWVENLSAMVDDIAPTPELRRRILDRDLTFADLEAALPDPATRPAVPGEILEQLTGKSQVQQYLSNAVERMFSWLGQKPTDALSRNPFFDHMYRAEVERLVTIMDDQVTLSADDLRRIEGQARDYALGESRNLLFNLAERSQLGDMLRHVAPFFMAWQEVLTRWAGIAYENPAFVARMRQVWASPERAGMVTDENGNIIDPDGGARDPITGEIVEAGDSRYVTMSLLPDFAQDMVDSIPGASILENAKFNKQSANIALSANPGVGPIVQAPVNEIVKQRPSLEDSVKFILPFGSSQSALDLFLPTVAKDIRDRFFRQTEDRVFHNTVMRIHFDNMTDYQLGKRADMPTYQEALDETKDLYSFRVAASFFSPVSESFDSPYQPYITTYRNAQRRLQEDETALGTHPDGTPITAFEWFIDEFGEEFRFLTQSLSKSNDSVPPTLEGYQARKKYRDLIEAYPDLGRFIIGEEGAGEFSRAVYDHQLSNSLAPGSGKTQRETPSFMEQAEQPDIRTGWLKYTRAMDLIDNARINRGLPNLQVKEAEDLALLKQMHTQYIASQYPDWYDELLETDLAMWDRRLTGLREIAHAPVFQNRPDRPEMATLRRYFELRDMMITALQSREFTSIDAEANQDLAFLWETLTSQLVEQDLAFGDLYHRYLERDPLEPIDPVIAESAGG